MKYILSQESKTNKEGFVLSRIQATASFRNYGRDIQSGELGGWIEGEKNLSQEDSCWIADEAEVFGGAKVSDLARVAGNAVISGGEIKSCALIKDQAKITCGIIEDGSIVYEKAEIHGGIIRGGSEISGEAKVYGGVIEEDSSVDGKTIIYGGKIINSWISGDAVVKNQVIKNQVVSTTPPPLIKRKNMPAPQESTKRDYSPKRVR